MDRPKSGRRDIWGSPDLTILVVLVLLLIALVVWKFAQRSEAQPLTPEDAVKMHVDALASLPPALREACARISAQGGQAPSWKRDLVSVIASRKIERKTFNVTCYCPFSRKTGQGCDWRGRWVPADPPGGGRGSAWGPRLRDGHCAVDTAVVPFGSVIVLDGLPQLLVAVDRGGAIDGDDLDVCVIDVDAYRALAKRYSHTKTTGWVVGRVAKADAR